MHEEDKPKKYYSKLDFGKMGAGEGNLCHAIIPSTGLCIFCKINLVDVKYDWEPCPVRLKEKIETIEREEMCKMLNKIFWIWKK